MSDPAGWYPDPTGRHEMRYWDGYAWLDNVSNKGAAATDPLGGKPMPAPSEAAAKAAAGPAPAAAKSKTPLFIGIGVAAVVVIAIVAFVVTRKSDDKNNAAKVTVLGDTEITLSEKGDDPGHPTVFPVRVKDNTVIIIDMKSPADDVTPGIIVEAKQDVVDKLNGKISGIQDLLTDKLKAACSNLREEDLGAQGDIAYFFDAAKDGAGSDLHTFTILPIGGDFEFIPVVVDSNGQCKGAKLDLKLTPHFLDFGGVTDRSDLESTLFNDPDLKDFVSG